MKHVHSILIVDTPHGFSVRLPENATILSVIHADGGSMRICYEAPLIVNPTERFFLSIWDMDKVPDNAIYIGSYLPSGVHNVVHLYELPDDPYPEFAD